MIGAIFTVCIIIAPFVISITFLAWLMEDVIPAVRRHRNGR